MSDATLIVGGLLLELGAAVGLAATAGGLRANNHGYEVKGSWLSLKLDPTGEGPRADSIGRWARAGAWVALAAGAALQVGAILL